MSLINIEYGALASSDVMNNNFEYLDNKISSVSENLTSNSSAIYSSIASVNNLIATVSDKLRPIGQPIIRLDNTIFEDEVRLEGAEVSRVTYSRLFEIYGITYGNGDGVNTFKLPDFRNRVMWGAEYFGYLSPTLPNITGTFYSSNTSAGFYADVHTGAFSNAGIPAQYAARGGVEAKNSSLKIDASRCSSIYQNGATVRPPAIGVRVVTRFK